MITRIVKMTFREEACSDFLAICNQFNAAIRQSPGCMYLRLYRDDHQSNIFFTYSHWDHEASLNNYRQSSTFQEVWPKTKALFAAPAEAWTLSLLDEQL